MQYFTGDVLLYDPFAEKEVQEAQDLKWEKAVQAYRARQLKLEGRLLKNVFKRFTTQSFHDYDLLSFQTEEQSNKALPLGIIISIQKGDELLELKYSNVQAFQVVYKNEISYRGLGSLVYDELLDVNDYFLSHEIMLSTGATIFIEFKNKGLRISDKKI